MSAFIFIEGGGDGQLHERSFRKAWSEFFRSAGLSGRMPAIVRGGGRKQTYEKFAHAVRVARARKLPVLLVDSEETVKTGHNVWEHLRRRDGWSRPEGAEDDQAFLMVVAMETWFPADRDLLTEHFGPKLDSSRGPVPARKGAPAQAEKPVVIRRVGPLQLVLRERAVRSSRRP